MRKFSWLAALLISAMFVTEPSYGQMAGKGAIWEFKAVNGSEEVKGQYRVYLKEVFRGKEKVGVVKPRSSNVTTLEITGYPKLNGKTVLRRASNGGPHWEGVLRKDDGSKWKIEIDIKGS